MYAENHDPQRTAGENIHRPPQGGRPLRCANCDIEILWPPTVVQGRAYCCTGCAAGGPCNCDYSQYHPVNIAGVIHYGMDKQT